MNTERTLKALRIKLAATRMRRDMEINSYVGARCISAMATSLVGVVENRQIARWYSDATDTAIVQALGFQLNRLAMALCGLETRLEHRNLPDAR